MQQKTLEMPRRSMHIQFKTKLRDGLAFDRGEFKMAKTQDYTKVLKDMMGAFPVDMTAMQDAFKSQAAFGEKMSHVDLEAAEKSSEISAKWTLLPSNTALPAVLARSISRRRSWGKLPHSSMPF